MCTPIRHVPYNSCKGNCRFFFLLSLRLRLHNLSHRWPSRQAYVWFLCLQCRAQQTSTTSASQLVDRHDRVESTAFRNERPGNMIVPSRGRYANGHCCVAACPYWQNEPLYVAYLSHAEGHVPPYEPLLSLVSWSPFPGSFCRVQYPPELHQHASG